MVLKRLTMVLAIGAMLLAHGFAQTPDFNQFKFRVKQFVDNVAGNIPAAAAIGGTWSDAYIGQFLPSVPPHFGVGVTTGAIFVAKEPGNELASAFGVELPDLIKNFGLPLPVIAVDGRLGGIVLPFDVGLKIGFIPQFASDLLPDVNLEYFLLGFDVRYPILQENVVLPGLSIGLGYSYLNASARMKIGDPVVMNNVPYESGGNNYFDGQLTLSAPELGVNWGASIIDLKAHLSKSLLILTPYVGLGASLAVGEVGAGYYSTLSLYRPTPNNTLTGQAAVDSIKATGFNDFDISPDGINDKSSVSGWGFRIYGGTSLNLLLIKVDLKALWNINTGAWGGDLGVRLQL